MVDFGFKRSVLKIREMSFGTFVDTKCSGCDVVYMHSNDTENKSDEPEKTFTEKQYTLVNDLTQSEDDLWGLLRKTYRNEIRRVENEAITFKIYKRDSEQVLEVVSRFLDTYNKMFESKSMGNRFNYSLVSAGIKAGNVVISVCGNDSGIEVFHAYLCDGNKTMLMYSASPLWESLDKEIVNQIGRMNKYLHWKDMQYFKKDGYTEYEWGGINDSENPNGIAKFKMGFGGTCILYHNYIVAKSFLGKLYVYLVKRKSKK